jgi:hypothetical protein
LLGCVFSKGVNPTPRPTVCDVAKPHSCVRSPLADTVPVAGHQFGSYNPQLGDGRAIMLGEHEAPDGTRYEIQACLVVCYFVFFAVF